MQYYEYKKTVDWNSRENELVEVLNKHRSKNNTWDVIVLAAGERTQLTSLMN